MNDLTRASGRRSRPALLAVAGGLWWFHTDLAAAAEGPKNVTEPPQGEAEPFKPEIHWEHRHGALVLVGLGAREDLVAGLIGIGSSFRSEYGHFGAQAMLNVALTLDDDGDDEDSDDVGLWGRAGAVLELFPLIRSDWQPHFGAGASFTFEGIPRASRMYAGLNVLAVAGLDHLGPDRHNGFAAQLVMDIPTSLGTSGRRAPFVTLEFGMKFFSRATTYDPIEVYEPPAPVVPAPVKPPQPTDDDDASEQGPVKVRLDTCELDVEEPILFGDNSDEPTEASGPVLNAIAKALVDHPDLTRIRLVGHTDERGSAAYNLNLSQRRVDAVIRALVSRGVEHTRLEGIGRGEREPVHPGARTDDEHAANRRVEYLIVGGPEACVEVK
jgi:outer membrane protein OmpA-like peptidoglycan-associated protein